MVPGMRGRADMPSAKKSLGSSGSYLGWLDIFCLQDVRRQKAESRRKSGSGRRSAEVLLPSAFILLPSLPGNIDDLAGMECLEKLPDGVEIELRIAGLDDEEELVARRLIEALHVEHGVIRHPQGGERE